MKKLNKKGFTLVELLAVIVILAILMTVAFSVVPGLQNDAKKSGMDTELRKVISTTYKDIQLISLGEASTYSYGVSPDTNHKMTITEGEYKIVLTLSDDNKSISAFCITDTKNGSSGTVSGNSIAYSANSEYVSTISSCS